MSSPATWASPKGRRKSITRRACCIWPRRPRTPMTEAPSEEQIAAEAALWQDRLREGPLGKGQRARFERWLAADPRHAERFGRMGAVRGSLEAVVDTPGIREMRNDALLRMSLRAPPRWRGAAAAAAAVVVLAGGAAVVFRSDIERF